MRKSRGRTQPGLTVALRRSGTTTGPPPKISVPARRMLVKKSSACVGALTTERATTMLMKKARKMPQLGMHGLAPSTRLCSRQQHSQRQAAPHAKLEVERRDEVRLFFRRVRRLGGRASCWRAASQERRHRPQSVGDTGSGNVVLVFVRGQVDGSRRNSVSRPYVRRQPIGLVGLAPDDNPPLAAEARAQAGRDVPQPGGRAAGDHERWVEPLALVAGANRAAQEDD